MYFVYILTNKSNTVLYTGVTNDLKRRLTEHYLQRSNKSSFCGKYLCHHLIYYEEYKYISDAIAREKEIKTWRKEKKLALIKLENKDFTILNDRLFDLWPPPET